jgi:hypothetical protein
MFSMFWQLAVRMHYSLAKEIVMMKTLLASLGLFGLMVGVAAAGEAASIKAKVPFDFKIGSRTIPAGEYYLSKDGPAGVLSLRSLDNDVHVKFLADRVHQENVTREPKLVFNTYGGQYYLGEVWMAGKAEGSSVVKGKAEREAASGRAASTPVVVAAR